MSRLAASSLPLAVAAALLLPGGAPRAATPTLLRLDGIGPLKLGMDHAAAVRTGWLTHRGSGCPLGGTPPVTYRLGGKAPDRVRGGVEFQGGKLKVVVITRGVRTAAGVTVATTSARAASRYRAAGFKVAVKRSTTFGGTFVTVTKAGKSVLGAFAQRGRITTLGVPFVPVCD